MVTPVPPSHQAAALPDVPMIGLQPAEPYKFTPENELRHFRNSFAKHGCQELIHPTTLQGHLRKLRLNLAVYSPNFFQDVTRVSWGAGGLYASILGIHALYGHFFHSDDPPSYRLYDSRLTPIFGTAALGTLFAVLGVVSPAIYRTAPADRMRFQKCLELVGDIREQEALVRLQERPPATTPGSEMVALSVDIGLGTTAVAGAAFSRGGTGLVDQVMMGLAAVGVAIAAPEIAIPRAAAMGWRQAAGAL